MNPHDRDNPTLKAKIFSNNSWLKKSTIELQLPTHKNYLDCRRKKYINHSDIYYTNFQSILMKP